MCNRTVLFGLEVGLHPTETGDEILRFDGSSTADLFILKA